MAAQLTANCQFLFGGSNGRPWDEKDWTASDDRVRGGKSISHMGVVRTATTSTAGTRTPASNDNGSVISEHNKGEGKVSETQPSQQHQDNDNDREQGLATTCTAAKFSGNLDITALGGAGFASQRTTIFEGEDGALDLRGYDGLVLRVVHHSDDTNSTPEHIKDAVAVKERVKKYTVVLKDTILPKRPDGREQSTISWESDFSLAGEETETITLPFSEFKPTYRGKPVEDPDAKLDWGSIKRVSIMVRSFFGEQHGPFSLVISSIAARKPQSSEMGCTIL